MLIPRHCTNPKCHKPYGDRNPYREVLVKLSTEPQIRVMSLCKECLKDYDMEMAKDMLKDIMDVEMSEIMDNALMTDIEKVRRVNMFSNYTITAIARNIDEMNKKL